MSREEFAARLSRLRSDGGSEADFESAVSTLAQDLPPVRWGTLLKIARVGWEAFDLRRPAGSAEGGPEPGGEQRLADDLWRCLADAGFDREDPRELGLVVPGYVVVPARSDFTDVVGWGRSLDAHTLCMLVVERAFESLGWVEVDERTEIALFGWLDAADHAEPSRERLDRLASRRRLRLAVRQRRAGEVAALLCEAPLPPGWFDGVLARLVSGPYSADQLREMLEQLAAGDEEGSTRWGDCRRGFAAGGDLDLTTASTADSSYVHGLLLRWLVDQDVPVTAARTRWSESYVRLLLTFLAPHPSREVHNAPIQAHQ
ncbi:MAG TPA: hypothetical protein VFP34_09240, partial [Microlunatus sp.]|nr:hypothetical protein [Microlunatus sp.]